jgi:hypothetical protein
VELGDESFTVGSSFVPWVRGAHFQKHNDGVSVKAMVLREEEYHSNVPMEPRLECDPDVRSLCD